MNRGIRFTDEFKQDAVAQVVERGYAVSEVAERLGISTKSLYTWKARFAKSPSVRSEVAKLSLSVTTSRLSGMFRWKAPRLPSLQASPAAATLRHKAGNRTKEGVPIFGAPLHAANGQELVWFRQTVLVSNSFRLADAINVPEFPISPFQEACGGKV